MASLRSTNSKFRHKHPYETEILKLEYPSSIYERECTPYQPMETTSATFVNTFEGVLDMLADLKKAKEIAIDTEHHDFRTYSGLLSLMQISTRDQDWIVDTLQPWRHKLEVLNEVFADPKIIKVGQIPLSLEFPQLIVLGSARGLHGHHLAPTRSGFVCGWSIRYIPCG